MVEGTTATGMRSTIDEYVQANTSMGQPGALTDFADKPLVLLTATDGNAAGWQAKQDKVGHLVRPIRIVAI